MPKWKSRSWTYYEADSLREECGLPIENLHLGFFNLFSRGPRAIRRQTVRAIVPDPAETQVEAELRIVVSYPRWRLRQKRN
jgi:hypothetical protein